MPPEGADAAYLWDIIAHEYGEIKHELMWKVISDHIPELIQNLEQLIPPVPE